MDALRLADRNVGVDAASLDLTPLEGNQTDPDSDGSGPTNDFSKELFHRVGP